MSIYNNSEKIKKYFPENDEYISFLVFNMILILYKYKQIPQNCCDNNNFYILEIMLLYDYIFIRDDTKNVKIKYEVIKVIKKIFKAYSTSSEIDLIISNLKNFFFESGIISINTFLISEDDYEYGIIEFNYLINIIKEIIKFGLKYPNIIDNLKILNKLKKSLNMEEENVEIETTNENKENSKEENNNMKKIIKDLQEAIPNINNENQKKFNEQQIMMEKHQKKFNEELKNLMSGK